MQTLNNFLINFDSEQTRRSYTWMLTRAFKWCEDNQVDLYQFTPDKFLTWLSSNNWNENSRYLAYCAVRSFLSWSFGEYSPFVGYTMRRVKPKVRRTLSLKQAQNLFESMDTSNDYGKRNLAIVTLMLNTGMRSIEMERALISDLDLNDLTLQILCKGRQWRTAKFSPYTGSCIAAWLGVREQWERYMPLANTLFVTKYGGKFDGRYIRKLFNRLGIQAGLHGGFSPHDLRRSFATLATRAGAPARIVMVAGGWTDLESFIRYTMAVTPSDLAPYDPVEYVMNN